MERPIRVTDICYNVLMAELKTKKNRASVTTFLDAVENKQRREDAKKLLTIFKEVTGMKPAMWGTSIVGFGTYHYESERSTQKGDWPLTGFSPRTTNLTVYIGPGFKNYKVLLGKIGKHKTSVGCLYISKLSDIHVPTLSTIIQKSVKEMQRRYRTK